MYQNGYVPPQSGDGERRRRAQRVPAVPSRVMDAAAAAYQQQRRDTAAPLGNRPNTNDPRRSGNPQANYGGSYARYPMENRPTTAYEDRYRRPPNTAIPPQDASYTANRGGQAAPPPARDMYGNPMGYPAQGYYQQGSTAGTGGGEPPRKRGGKRWLALAIVVLLLAGGGYGGYRYMQYASVANAVQAYDNVFCQGVYVDGIHLGGMTPDEAIAAVQAQAQERNSAWKVRLIFSGQLVTEITADQLGMTVDIMDVMNQAWSQGHVGDIYQRQAAMEALAETPFQAYTAMPSGDTSVIDGILQDIKNNVYRAPQDARLLTFDPSQSYPFTFQEEMQGRYLDTEPLKERLYQMVSTMESGDVEIIPQVIEPSVTVEDLKANLTLRATAQTPISTSSTTERTNNIRRSFQLISGTIVKAGEKFSFNGVVGERTEKNGFYPAIEYAYGESVMGIGGGVCQASTTVYQAAVAAGMEIVTREPHSDAVSYASYGEDATVYWSNGRKIDLVFKNNTEHDIYMVAAVEADSSNSKRLVATVSIYGEDLGNIRYELQSKTVEVIPVPTEPKYIEDKNQSYVTYTDEEYEVKGKEGYVVESYRVTYENDNVISRELLYTDTYKAKQPRIYVGTKTREEEP